MEYLDSKARIAAWAKGSSVTRKWRWTLVRQFFASLQAGDYDAAGRLVPPGAAARVKEHLSTVKILRIVSIGPATPVPGARNKTLAVPCTIEYEENGQKKSVMLKAVIVQQAGRWVLQDLDD